MGGVLFIIIGSFALSGFLAEQKEPPEVEEAKIPKKYVRTTPVAYTDVETEVIAFGRVRSAESLDLIAEQSGRMSAGSVTLKEGQKFSKGDLLFVVDDTEAKLNLQAQKSNFLKDLASILPDFKLDFKDSYGQWYSFFESIDLEKPLPKLPDYNSGKEKTFLATKNIFNSYYSIKSSEAALRKYKMYAPFNGTISEVKMQSGSFVNPGTNVASVKRTDRLELKVDVELTDIQWINKGKRVNITTESGQQSWTGKIVRIGEVVNENTQSIDVHLQIDRSQSPIYDGLYLQSKIPGKVVNDAMVIPRNAVVNGNEVFVVQDTLLKRMEIQVHRVTSDRVVFSGLKEGEDLVTEPVLNAYNNMVVYKLTDGEGDGIDIERKAKTKLVSN